MYNTSDKVIDFITEAMKNWRVELTAGQKTLTKVKTQIAIFQVDSLSSSLTVIAIMLLNHLLRKYTGGFKFTNSQE